MSEWPRRRFDDTTETGELSLGRRLERIEARIDRLERGQMIIVLLFTIDTLLTAGDVITKLPTIVRAFGG